MSTWRRLALELFPERRRLLQDKETSIYWVFFELLPETISAHVQGDKPRLERIYRFASWCFHQYPRAPDIGNAACTAFYEHLADQESTWNAIVDWVQPEVFALMRNEFQKRVERKAPGTFVSLQAEYNRVHGTQFR